MVLIRQGARQQPALAIATLAMDLIWLNPQENAVCNDGSKAGYYYAKGADDSKVWLVYLEGGGWCGDERDCKTRCEDTIAPWCSSSTWTETRDVTSGLFFTQKEMLQGAHNVFVPQCSSDAHMGNGASFGMQFRGAVIVEAVFKDLVKRGLGKSGKDLLVFGGESAGARGAMVHLDYVPQYLGDRADSVEVVGFLDSPLWIDMPPKPKARFIGFRHMCRNVWKHANVTRLGETCASLHPPAQQFKCLMGQYRLPHVRTPYVLIASQYDSFQLGFNLGRFPSEQEDNEYVERFRRWTKDSIYGIAGAAKKNNSRIAIYSSACYVHARTWCEHGVVTDTAGRSNSTVADELVRILLRKQSGARIVIDECKGVGCGTGCWELDPETLAPIPPSGSRESVIRGAWSVLPLVLALVGIHGLVA